jgi:ADP-ribose pyrophosphatase
MHERRVASIEVTGDDTATSRCDEGFLRIRRLRVCNVYDDGSRSAEYRCDVVSRRAIDAVAVVLYEIGADRRVRVVLKDGVRPATYLRRSKELVHPDAHEYRTVLEIAAGVLEPSDVGPDAIERRAAAEAHEECALEVDPAAVQWLGGEMFPSPGVGDEKVFFRAASVHADDAGVPQGDGSVMEESTLPVVLDLGEAIARCRDGSIPDMKTEIALLRLADRIGYLPQLRLFRDELPAAVRDRFRAPGLEPRDA